MTVWKLTTVIALAMLTSSCAWMCDACKTREPGAEPRANACLIDNTRANTCRSQGGHLVCDLYVYNTPGGTVVYPYTLLVPARQKAKLVWPWIEPKMKFESGDGPIELKRNPEFEDGGPTDDPDGTIIARSGKKYTVFDKNTVGKRHAYTIQFRSSQQSSTEFSCDPYIENEAN